jgi:hypothetical protein
MLQPTTFHREFAQVIKCASCSKVSDKNLLRDTLENVPQPGYVGSNYQTSRVLLVGQNPSCSKILEVEDKSYTSALRTLGDFPTPMRYAELAKMMDSFIPKWPVHGNYFPLSECGLNLSDIAYCNLVRCRISNNAPPGSELVARCRGAHFIPWLHMLSPRVVVFIGKWAADHGASAVDALCIPHMYMNRLRSLSTVDRATNRAQVVALVKRHRGF